MNYKRNHLGWLKGILGFVLTVVIIAGGIGLASYFIQKDGVAVFGQNGIAGQSAYDIAVDNGFVGTESEWLASLKGATVHKARKATKGITG